MLKYLLLLGCFMGGLARAEDVRERLNKIFYWHLSDELKLSPQQEKEMTAVIEGLQQRRQAAFEMRDKTLESLRKQVKEPKPGETDKLLERYKATFQQLSALDVEEHDKLKALLGSETLARYYVVREEVLARVRNALKNADQPSKK
ncbi:MAG: hypothetical protein JST16_00170 [Bdellovibrionales bacterium]|nr:hypothetical protein [Bdellovibrionales bacterium]